MLAERQTTVPRPLALSAEDKVIIALVVFFSAVALTLELYWLVYHDVMESRVDPFARLLSVYGAVDRTYRIPGYAVEKAFTLSVEGVNTFITPVLSAILVWAIIKRTRARYALQLVVATYTTYGTFLYYCVAHISGYAVFADKNFGTYLMFYLASLPWLCGYAWMGWHAYRAIVRGER